MLRVLTSVHDPVALAATCRGLGLPPPQQGQIRLNGGVASGWVIRLPGLSHPVVCDALTGLVAYHRQDNDFEPYGCLMCFLLRYYTVRGRLRYTANGSGRRRAARPAVRGQAPTKS
jgi:hypothetical protein